MDGYGVNSYTTPSSALWKLVDYGNNLQSHRSPACAMTHDALTPSMIPTRLVPQSLWACYWRPRPPSLEAVRGLIRGDELALLRRGQWRAVVVCRRLCSEG